MSADPKMNQASESAALHAAANPEIVQRLESVEVLGASGKL